MITLEKYFEILLPSSASERKIKANLLDSIKNDLRVNLGNLLGSYFFFWCRDDNSGRRRWRTRHGSVGAVRR